MQRVANWSVFAASLLAAALLLAETPAASGAANYKATTANISGAGDAVRIEILRWSTDEERDRLLGAWQLRSAAPSGAGAAKGAGKAGKANGRGAAPATSAEAVTPESALAKALQEATTVGYLWSSELAGYALRYAGRVTSADGSQRVVLITQRRLGAVNQRWTLSSGAANNYEFSVVELRLNAKGVGEGKASLTGKIAVDAAAKIVSLENFETLPVVFRDVRIVQP